MKPAWKSVTSLPSARGRRRGAPALACLPSRIPLKNGSRDCLSNLCLLRPCVVASVTVPRRWHAARKMMHRGNVVMHSYGIYRMSAQWRLTLLGLKVGRQDHFGPFLSFFGDKLPKVGRRTSNHYPAQVGEPRL